MAGQTSEDYTQLLAQIKTDFDDRLSALAADPQQWVEFIDQVAEFGARYSLANQILLWTQTQRRQSAAQYFLPYGNKAGTTGWLAQHRQVRAGEKAYKIWAPVKRRPTDEQAAQMEAAGRTVRREPDGRPALQVTGFRLVNTFELAQTDGQPFEVPTVRRLRRLRAPGAHTATLLTGEDPSGVYDELVTLIRAEGYSMQLLPPGTGFLGRANGVTVARGDLRLVQVRDDVDAAQRTKTTAHELAHIRCGHTDHSAGTVVHRGRFETEAESVAHIVLAALGLDTRDYSDAYVLSWAGGDMDLVRSCAETVLRTAKTILTDLTAQPPAAGAAAQEEQS